MVLFKITSCRVVHTAISITSIMIIISIAMDIIKITIMTKVIKKITSCLVVHTAISTSHSSTLLRVITALSTLTWSDTVVQELFNLMMIIDDPPRSMLDHQHPSQ